jgi:hypothetical protein
VTDRPVVRRGTILARSARRDQPAGAEGEGQKGLTAEAVEPPAAPKRQRPLVAEPLSLDPDSSESELIPAQAATEPVGESPPARPRRGGRPSGTSHAAWAAIAGLLVVALLLALFGLQQRSKLQRGQRESQQLRQVSGALVAALTTYDYQKMDDWKNRFLAHAVGSLRNSFNQLAPGTTQLVVGTHQRSTGTVQDVLIGPIQGGRATTMVVANVTVTGLSGTRQFATHDRLSLLKVGGRWQVDDLDSVNYDPSTGSGITPAPGTPTPANSASTSTTPPPPTHP